MGRKKIRLFTRPRAREGGESGDDKHKISHKKEPNHTPKHPPGVAVHERCTTTVYACRNKINLTFRIDLLPARKDEHCLATTDKALMITWLPAVLESSPSAGRSICDVFARLQGNIRSTRSAEIQIVHSDVKQPSSILRSTRLTTHPFIVLK